MEGQRTRNGTPRDLRWLVKSELQRLFSGVHFRVTTLGNSVNVSWDWNDAGATGLAVNNALRDRFGGSVRLSLLDSCQGSSIVTGNTRSAHSNFLLGEE